MPVFDSRITDPSTRNSLRRRLAAVYAVLVLVLAAAGVMAFAAVRSQTGDNATVISSAKPSQDELAESAKVAKLFVQTAVAREDLDRAYPIVTESIRQHMTLAEWETGFIAAWPYKFDDWRWKIGKDSTSQRVVFYVVLLGAAGTGDDGGGQMFRLEAVHRGGSWLVDYWAPFMYYAAMSTG